MTLGQQIKEAREKKNMSQEELAESIGVSRQAVSKWENDTASPHGINRETLAQVLELDLESNIIIQKRVPIIAWTGWIVAGVLLVLLIFIGIKLLPLILKPIDEQNIIIAEESVQIKNSAIESICFFDENSNKVYPDAGWYDASQFQNILISWSGGPAESIQMFVTPTGTETLDKTELVATKAITYSETAALLSANALHNDKISTSHLYFEICIGEEIIRSETFNIFYDSQEK